MHIWHTWSVMGYICIPGVAMELGAELGGHRLRAPPSCPSLDGRPQREPNGSQDMSPSALWLNNLASSNSVG